MAQKMRAALAQQYGADTVILTRKKPMKKVTFRKGGVDQALMTARPFNIEGD